MDSTTSSKNRPQASESMVGADQRQESGPYGLTGWICPLMASWMPETGLKSGESDDVQLSDRTGSELQIRSDSRSPTWGTHANRSLGMNFHRI